MKDVKQEIKSLHSILEKLPSLQNAGHRKKKIYIYIYINNTATASAQMTS